MTEEWKSYKDIFVSSNGRVRNSQGVIIPQSNKFQPVVNGKEYNLLTALAIAFKIPNYEKIGIDRYKAMLKHKTFFKISVSDVVVDVDTSMDIKEFFKLLKS